jgi:AcrR family transcriptional regulator
MASTDRAPSLAERRKQELRAEIVDAAFAEFSERGYHDTGIAHIAERLGIGHGTFYRYFENKRDILDHVMTGLIERTMSALAADNAPDAATSLEEYRAQTERIAEALTRILDEDPRVLRMLLLEATSIDAELTERVLGVFATAEQMTAAYFENGVARGYLRKDLDVDATATAVVGAMLGAMVRALREPGDTEQHLRVSRAVLRMMLEGIVAER